MLGFGLELVLRFGLGLGFDQRSRFGLRPGFGSGLGLV